VNSALYYGTIRHRRFAERKREFRHGIAMAYVDLDELDELARLARWLPIGFERDDYFGDGDLAMGRDGGSIAAAVRRRIAADGEPAPEGPIRVLTQLRSFGHCFNPVSFYYCFDRDERLQALLAEVTNTPWGERQAYVLKRGGVRGGVIRGESEKLLHVSPFFGMDQRYEWRVADPGETLAVHIENHDGRGRAFDATLALERRKLTRGSLAAMTARYPVATLRILALIYGHAAAIRMRGVRTRPHPARAAG
jgi:DUF1365 family protein